jgi:hypothetical protein
MLSMQVMYSHFGNSFGAAEFNSLLGHVSRDKSDKELNALNSASIQKHARWPNPQDFFGGMAVGLERPGSGGRLHASLTLLNSNCIKHRRLFSI